MLTLVNPLKLNDELMFFKSPANKRGEDTIYAPNATFKLKLNYQNYALGWNLLTVSLRNSLSRWVYISVVKIDS